MSIRSAVAWACAVVCALGTPGVAEADCASTAEGGFDQVVFSTETATFSTVLPFDVPVRVCADVPAGTSKALVRFAANPRRRGPLDVDPETCAIRTQGVVWSRTYDRVPAGTTVRWLLDRLEAERYYAFCFYLERKVTDAEQTAFRAAARQVLDDGIARVASANLSAEQTNAICQDLASRLREVTGANQVLETDGTLFACEGAKVGKFAEKVNRGPLEAQRNAALVLEGDAQGVFPSPSLAARQNDLQADLAQLQQSQALARLMDLLAREAALDAAVAGREQSLCPGCDSLVGAAATAPPSLALGGAGSPVLGMSSDPALAQDVSKSYAATAGALAALPGLIGWATAANAPAALDSGLTAADREELRALTSPGGLLQRAAGKTTTLGSVTAMLARHLQGRATGLASLAEEATVEAQSVVLADATTLANFETNQKNYISLDAGMTWAPEIDEVVPYLGTNIYFRPVNRNAPLATLGNFRQTFSRRFALTFGLTASSIADDGAGGGAAGAAARDDLFASQSLLLGAGIRVTDAIRLGGGALVFKHDDPSPLVDESELNTSYYLSLSFDADVVKLFSKTFGAALGVAADGTP